MAWNPAERYLVRRRPDAVGVRESLPSDTVPPGLAPDADDEQVAVAASREELATVQDINGLPQATRHRAGADPWWYGGGGPLVEDISQGRGLGDCYLLALFACVARHDPDLLRRILPPDAAVHLKGVLSSDTYAWLYAHWDERSTHALAYLWRDLGTREAPFYLPQAFQLSATFARDDGRLTGAQARVEPERETWKVRRQGTVRYVERVVEYRSVRWPALLEKAFAAFFGNYGKRGDGQALQGTAYAVLGEGARSAHQFLRLLYGPQIRAVDNVALDALRLAVVGEGPPDERGVAVKALQALLRMRSQGPDVLLMTTSTSDPYIIERLRAMLPEGKTHYSAAEALHRAMTAVMKTTEIGMQRADSSDEPEPEVDPETLIARKAAEREALQKAVDLMLGELTAELDVLAPARAAYLLRDLLVTLRVPSAPSGVDDTPRRFLYCDHEYALLQTHLVFEGGAPDLNDIGALETALMKRLDAARSTVTLYNPHGQNSPNVDPGAPGSEDTGLFTLPLERFLNVSYRLNYTTVTRR
jgi:hypothetical protein